MKQLTVRELIALLAEEELDRPVTVEGCDCDRGAVAVKGHYEDTVLIESASWSELAND